MKTWERYAIAALIFVFVYGCFMWIIQSYPVREAYVELTPQQKQIVKKAIKKHGDYPIEMNKETGKMIMIRNGKIIKL